LTSANAPRASAASWQETVLYRFPASGAHGFDPWAGLVFDAQGNLYGTTYRGGAYNQGTVFKLTPPVAPATEWTETVLHSFSGADGANPRAGVIFDAQGNLYGTTPSGGAFSKVCGGVIFDGEGPPGCGTVFKLTPPAAPSTQWTETVLHSFGGLDGVGPYAGVIFDAQGNLYGTTAAGGNYIKGCGANVGFYDFEGCGTVFKLTPPVAPSTQWTETVLYGFSSEPDGSLPSAGLIFDARGNLYGTTERGGGASVGTVFKLTPPVAPATQWIETVLHSFNGADGGFPGGLIFDAQGNLYGTAGSTAFKLTPPVASATQWTETVLHSFNGGYAGSPNPHADGESANGSLIFDAQGNLYGTTEAGGNQTGWCLTPTGEGCGTVFKLTPPVAPATQWKETILYRFPATSSGGALGANPLAGLIFDAQGHLYGTTSLGGAATDSSGVSTQCSGDGWGCGTVFKLEP
jgi:uncharacterized repeat protein (TIGR03803 family)